MLVVVPFAVLYQTVEKSKVSIGETYYPFGLHLNKIIAHGLNFKAKLAKKYAASDKSAKLTRALNLFLNL